MKWFIFIGFLTSCSISSVSEVGVIHPALGLRSTLRPDTNPLNAVKASQRLAVAPCQYLRLETGPFLLQSHQGQIQGVEAALRIRAQNPTPATPYTILIAGVGYAPGWRGSDVSYTFTSELGIGLEYRIHPRVSLAADFRLVHHSNGKSFFGDQTRQFFNIKKAVKNEGYENGAIFVGLTYDF